MMRVVLWGTYDTGKPRTRILREGLRQAGVDLHEIHASIWEGIEDKSQIRGVPRKLRIAIRWLLAYPRLIWGLMRTPRPDCLLVGYPGLLDVLVACLITRTRRIPLAWDVFLSMYDTVCEDRRLLAPRSLAGRLLHALEGRALRCADLPFMDTRAHARRLESLFNLPSGHCGAVWVGAETAVFKPTPPSPRPHRDTTRVMFYGQFIPLHGIATIIEAARLLQNHPIEWQLIGSGQDAGAIRELLDADPLPKLHWTQWVEYECLADWIANADICLGIFGTSAKAASVIPNKVFQILAAGRPLITRDSPAIRELLTPAAGCVHLVEAGNPTALADAVLEMRSAAGTTRRVCHTGLADSFGARAIGRQFIDMIGQRSRARNAASEA